MRVLVKSENSSLPVATRVSKTRLLKDDFQSVLGSLRTIMFLNIINGSLDGMRIDVIR